MKKIQGNWDIIRNAPKYGKYNEASLLGMSTSKRLGMFRECPGCSKGNFIFFKTAPVKTKSGYENSLTSTVPYVTCSCGLSYGLK